MRIDAKAERKYGGEGRLLLLLLPLLPES